MTGIIEGLEDQVKMVQKLINKKPKPKTIGVGYKQ
tara:strand:+ start:164 stop:268 length:105 start_codon:yes stop_codon:yes gene_type:complete